MKQPFSSVHERVGGARVTYELFEEDYERIRNLRIRTQLQVQWDEKIAPFLSEIIDEPSAAVASALGIDHAAIPGEISLKLQGGEHSDIDVTIGLFDHTMPLAGFIQAPRTDPTISNVVDYYESGGVILDEVLLAISGAEEHLYAVGTIQPSPVEIGGYVLDVVTALDDYDI